MIERGNLEWTGSVIHHSYIGRFFSATCHFNHSDSCIKKRDTELALSCFFESHISSTESDASTSHLASEACLDIWIYLLPYSVIRE